MDTVKRAAALLDRAKPGWENLIDTETLNLNRTACCVLGQVYGEDEYEDARFWFVRQGFGFGDIDTPFVEIHGNATTTDWLTEIHDRRAKYNNPAQLQIDFKKVAA